MNMEMLFLPVYGKNKMPVHFGYFIVGVSSNPDAQDLEERSINESRGNVTIHDGFLSRAVSDKKTLSEPLILFHWERI